jgi:tetratricopeptide (TPR) repeat protein
MKQLIGEGHRRIVDLLATRVRAVAGGDGNVPRAVILQGASGIGKSRVVRELYRVLRIELDGGKYWPELQESGGGDSRSPDPLPGRKSTGPQAAGFVWPADALPGFAWWQLHCERMQAGEGIDVVAQCRPEIEAHLVPVALSWNRAASFKGKMAAKKGLLVDRAREALREGGLEAATEILKQFDIAVPGLGLAASWLIRGVKRAREHHELRQATLAEIDIGQRVEEQRRSVNAELASLILGVAHPQVPAVVVIEDIHLMDAGLSEFLDHLAAPNAAHPVVVVGMAWPESRDAPAFAKWWKHATDTGRAEWVETPYLEEAERVQIVRAYAPKTADQVAVMAARRYSNPLALEATLASPVVERAIARNNGALPADALSAQPVALDDVYRRRFRELSDPVRLALAAAAGSLPDTTAGHMSPFVRTMVAKAVQRCPAVPAEAVEILASIEDAAEGRVWLVPGGVADSFREALQAQVAYEHLQREILLPQDLSTFRESVVEVLAAWVDEARDDGYILDPSEEAVIISRWLLAVAPPGDRTPTLLTAAGRVAAELASIYQYGAAAMALAPYLGAGSTDDADMLNIRGHHASWLGEAGRVEEAITAFQQLLRDCLRVLGPDAPDTLAARGNLASWLGKAGRVEEAITAFQQLLRDCLRVLGPDAPVTLATRNNLAHWLGKAGRVEEAVTALQQLLTDCLRVLGPDSPKILATRNNLAGWLSQAGRVKEAIIAFEQLLTDCLRVLGPDAPDTLTTRNNLANQLGRAGHLDEAITAFQQLLPDRIRVLGPNAQPTLITRRDLAGFLYRANRIDEAIDVASTLHKRAFRSLGPQHPLAQEAAQLVDSLRAKRFPC